MSLFSVTFDFIYYVELVINLPFNIKFIQINFGPFKFLFIEFYVEFLNLLLFSLFVFLVSLYRSYRESEH